MNARNLLKKLGLLSLGLFFVSAPYWTPFVRQIGGRNLFITSDSVMLLGLTLLLFLLGGYLIPDFCVSGRKPGVPKDPSRTSRLLAMTVHAIAWIAALAVLTYGIYWVNQRILHAFFSSGDEHSYHFLAQCLLQGKLYAAIPAHADFFDVAHIGMKGGKWFSVYALGWPLIMALGIKAHLMDWMNPVMSAASVFIFYLSARHLFGTAVAALAAVMLVLNPFFLFTAASYFSHATCLLAISIFLYSFLRWRDSYDRGGDPVFWAALCGLSAGYGLMTRYVTMAFVIMPFMLYHALPLFFDFRGFGKATFLNRQWPVPQVSFKRPHLRKSDWVFLSLTLVTFAVYFAHNFAVSGKFYKAPNAYHKSWMRLGFMDDYTVGDGLFFLLARIFYLIDWTSPGFVVVYLMIVAGYLKRLFRPERTETGAQGSLPYLRPIASLIPVVLAFAYFLFNDWGGNQFGPRYYWEGYPFLCFAVSAWIAATWRGGTLRMRKGLLAFTVMSFIASGVLFVKHAEFYGEASRQRRALYDLADGTIHEPAVVLIRGALGQKLILGNEDVARNDPSLSNAILYARDLGGRNTELMAAYPGRTFYLGYYDRDALQPRLERLRERSA